MTAIGEVDFNEARRSASYGSCRRARSRGDARLGDGLRNRRDRGARSIRTLERRCLRVKALDPPRVAAATALRAVSQPEAAEARGRGQGELRRDERRGRRSRRERADRAQARAAARRVVARAAAQGRARAEAARERPVAAPGAAETRVTPDHPVGAPPQRRARMPLLRRRLGMPVYHAVRIRRRVRGRRQVRRQHSLRRRRLLRLGRQQRAA